MASAKNQEIETASFASWDHGSSHLLRNLNDQVKVDGFSLAVLEPGKPDADAFIAGAGLKGDQIGPWCASGSSSDPLFQEAVKKGSATGRGLKTKPSPPAPGKQIVIATEQATPGEKAVWVLIGGREKPFSEDEVKAWSLALHSIRTAFDFMPEPGMSRLVLAADDRVIHADPVLRARALSRPQLLTELSTSLRPIIEQRWPETEYFQRHDLSFELDGEPVWVRFHFGHAPGDSEGEHLYLELRPLTADDVPPAGLVPDDRIAQAAAYISDRFASAPNLAEIAASVETSPFHFHRLFSKQMKISPKHFQLRLQMQIAKWMLRAGRKPIGTIATETGFSSHGHFTATFHRIVGVSPTQYREQS
ncbi:helix-turn-helix transcriptional regulator [Mucisphaera sp.]|uniref:helix-turn-helix transcriptional regulator n=1 Tax=Mucisphaera sp. TaxID=2913024 RepID=UPI003D0BE710